MSAAGYSQEFEKSAHWSSLICISLSWKSFRHPLLCWIGRGAGMQRRFCPGGITHLQPPFTLICGTGRKRSLSPTAVAVQPPLQSSITSEEPAKVFLLVLVPSFGSLHAGLSVVLHSPWCPSHLRADDPLPPTPLPRDFVPLDSPRDFRP